MFRGEKSTYVICKGDDPSMLHVHVMTNAGFSHPVIVPSTIYEHTATITAKDSVVRFAADFIACLHRDVIRFWSLHTGRFLGVVATKGRESFSDFEFTEYYAIIKSTESIMFVEWQTELRTKCLKRSVLCGPYGADFRIVLPSSKSKHDHFYLVDPSLQAMFVVIGLGTLPLAWIVPVPIYFTVGMLEHNELDLYKAYIEVYRKMWTTPTIYQNASVHLPNEHGAGDPMPPAVYAFKTHILCKKNEAMASAPFSIAGYIYATAHGRLIASTADGTLYTVAVSNDLLYGTDPLPDIIFTGCRRILQICESPDTTICMRRIHATASPRSILLIYDEYRTGEYRRTMARTLWKDQKTNSFVSVSRRVPGTADSFRTTQFAFDDDEQLWIADTTNDVEPMWRLHVTGKST